MHLIDDLLLFALRVGELIFAAVVTGITGSWLHQHRHEKAWSHKRFIYTEVIAVIGMVWALVFLLPFTRSFLHYPGDFILFVLFMIAFGLLTSFIGPMHCGSIWHWHGITGSSQCSKFKADIAFIFMASIFFLASSLLGAWYFHRRVKRDGDAAAIGAAGGRRRWFGKSRV